MDMQSNTRRARAFAESPELLAKFEADQRKVNRLNELRSPQEQQEEARVDARGESRGESRGDEWGNLAKSTHRPAPAKGILKSNGVAPALAERPPELDRRLDDDAVASNENEDAAYAGMMEAKSTAGATFADVDVKAGYNRRGEKVKGVVGLPDVNSDPASADQSDAASSSARGVVVNSATTYADAMDRSDGSGNADFYSYNSKGQLSTTSLFPSGPRQVPGFCMGCHYSIETKTFDRAIP